MKYLLGLLCIVSLSANSACYTVENLAGVNIKQYNKYEAKAESIRLKEVHLNFDGFKSNVLEHDLECVQPPKGLMMVCKYNDPTGRVTVETWSVDLKAEKVFYTKNMTGWDDYGVNGAGVFVGKLLGRCDA